MERGGEESGIVNMFKFIIYPSPGGKTNNCAHNDRSIYTSSPIPHKEEAMSCAK